MSQGNLNRSVEVFVVDTPRAASVALGEVRADAESTHVLCRHDDESTPEFERRVLRRIERIQKSRGVRSLWYVVGADAARGRCSVPLLKALLPLLESGASLTVVGPGSHQGAVFEWIDSIMHRRGNVTVRAQLYADAAEAPRRARALAVRAVDHGSTSAHSEPSLAWFARDASGGRGADTHVA